MVRLWFRDVSLAMQGRIGSQTVQEGDSEQLCETLTHVVRLMSDFLFQVSFKTTKIINFQPQKLKKNQAIQRAFSSVKSLQKPKEHAQIPPHIPTRSRERPLS